MEALTEELEHSIAAAVAWRWVSKGVRCYSQQDIYQDARVAVRKAAASYRPDSAASLKTFLYRCAVNATNNAISRNLAPVSSRSNGALQHLRQTRKVESTSSNVGATSDTPESAAFRAAVRARARAIVAQTPMGDVALQIILGETSAKDITPDPEAREQVYRATKRLRTALASDPALREYSR